MTFGDALFWAFIYVLCGLQVCVVRAHTLTRDTAIATVAVWPLVLVAYAARGLTWLVLALCRGLRNLWRGLP